jgi:hypothetical protein
MAIQIGEREALTIFLDDIDIQLQLFVYDQERATMTSSTPRASARSF